MFKEILNYAKENNIYQVPIGKYQNGNVYVVIFEDGTKIRAVEDDKEFVVEYPENMDIKITNYCEEGCKYCHENCTVNGEHGDFSLPFFNTIKPYTELALGANTLFIPNFKEFLINMRDKKVICNITVNQKTLMREKELSRLKEFISEGLVRGIGVSVYEVNEHLIELTKLSPNVIVHTIAGITSFEDLKKLYSNKIKILFLGYKHYTGRGASFYDNNADLVDKNLKDFKDNIKEITKSFKVVSFDNRALELLDIKSVLSEDTWNEFYLGEDGKQSMYIDIVKKEFALSSTSEKRYELKDDVIEMFNIIKK